MQFCARRRPRQSRLFLSLLFLALICSGCSYWLGNKTAQLSLDRAQPIAERLAAEQAKVRTLRSYARLVLTSEGRAYRASVAVLLERPDRFRIEFLGPLGHPHHIAAFDGKTFGELGNNKEIRLRDTSASGSTLSFLGLSPSTLVALVMGIPLESAGKLAVDHAFREPRGRTRLELQDERLLTVWTREQSGHPVIEKVFFGPSADGEPSIEILYADVREKVAQDEVRCWIPRIVTINIPDRGESLRIIFSDPDINAKLDPAFFRIGP
ncbi:MAG: hypothetical protein JW941_08460 [Candidatus Coatesbacteria bacterium]|nr:hypothetical protein [Candidatus Coatesbacteria bacterium]